ncbi:VanZ family protein [Amycolatopsis sp. H20-H5]|uniref:VanZ family protein n=1 Tax=Amycolatopsis sp. H20-H5 TaxID=3046309 RepID=UPI002DB8F932|nr:VanZ family protein [Amycolatopsis sp. H20-H5]MEC3977030.1 VanZ family protein [Amycolatopsis sp. H20-H5]
MSDLLRAFGAMIPLTMIAFSYALLAWPLLAARRRRRHPVRTASLTAAVDVAAVTLGLLALCLVTMPVGDSGTSTLDLTPGTDLVAAFADDGSIWQLLGNLLMLAPLGALLPLRVRGLRSLGRIVLAALIASTLVEGVQYLMHAGRVTSTDDVLLNTTGAAVGGLLSRRRWHSLDVRPTPPPLPQRIPAQVRRTVCESPTRTLRVPRSVWDTRYAAAGHPAAVQPEAH